MHDAEHWDTKYGQSDRLWSPRPNAAVEQILSAFPVGRALDLGAGEGRHAAWLAGRGWQCTAVDFSAVAIARGQQFAAEQRIEVEWVVADVTRWHPPNGQLYDVVLVVYLHMDDDVFEHARTWVAPGGALVVVGHAERNLTDGVGGPRNPDLLYGEAKMRRAAEGLSIERIGEVIRPTPDGDAIDFALVARREPN